MKDSFMMNCKNVKLGRKFLCLVWKNFHVVMKIYNFILDFLKFDCMWSVKTIPTRVCTVTVSHLWVWGKLTHIWYIYHKIVQCSFVSPSTICAQRKLLCKRILHYFPGLKAHHKVFPQQTAAVILDKSTCDSCWLVVHQNLMFCI